MEFHPTLGKPKSGPGVRLKRSSQEKKELGLGSYDTHVNYLTDEDNKMLKLVA